MSIKSVAFDHPTSAGACGVGQAWARVPAPQSPDQQRQAADRLRRLLRERDAVMIAHYYVDGPLQDLARETGGCVGDSLEMARFGASHPASTLVVAGVRFMGETAKILSPHKRVLMPDGEATCSLDLGCPADAFSRYCDAHPDRTVVVYANTSAAVKARADWVVTSSVGQDIVAHLHARGEKILWAPTATWAPTSRLRPAPTCCCGTAPAWCMTSSRPTNWPRCRASTRKRPSWSIPNRRPASPRWPMWSAPRRS